jgi:sugar/nucleoside kinase (ribokinase family)
MDTNDDPDNRWDRDVLDVLPWLDVLFPNEDEACRLARLDDPMRALDFLAARGPLVAMKRGDRGAVARRRSETFEAPPVKVPAVDTIGAGDSFDAGFLHQFVRGANIDDCLRYGNLTGALSTTRSGGTEAFREADYREAFLAKATIL